MNIQRNRGGRSQSYQDSNSISPPILLRNTRASTTNRQLARGGRNTILQRHVDYIATAGQALTTQQKNSNEINQNGHLKELACAPCLSAIHAFDKTFVVGRGAKRANEYFSCLVYVGKGKGGMQCARCVGLGSGSKCDDPPDDVLAETQALIRLIPAYNTALAANMNNVYSLMSTADQVAIDATIAASKRFTDAYNGLASAGIITKGSKKRKLDDNNMQIQGLGVLNQSSTDIRGDIATVATMIRTLATTVNSIAGTVEENRRYLRTVRERQRWTVTAVQGLISHANALPYGADLLEDEDGNEIPFPAQVHVPDLDLQTSGYETEDPELSDNEQ